MFTRRYLIVSDDGLERRATSHRLPLPVTGDVTLAFRTIDLGDIFVIIQFFELKMKVFFECMLFVKHNFKGWFVIKITVPV